MTDLAPRHRKLVILIGQLRYSYKQAAKDLGLSPRTVEKYAVEARDRTYPDLHPRDALTRAFWEGDGADRAQKRTA